MELVNVNNKALSQVFYIIDGMYEVNKNRIPLELKNKIYEKMDKEYIYNKDEELLLETKEILYAIFYKYVLNNTQKQKVDEYFKFYDTKIEEQKIGKYQIQFKEKETNLEIPKEEMQLTVVKKENLIKRIINKIKTFFKR